ncbi:MAG: hypothetical protein CMH17_11890 [Methylophaga sp.]|jgi:hypothetical protein|nr:hypothetical protein [Methylophaga sp.]HBX60951.1 hypothetical protein [Methylophaga sp.]HCN99835.1 hypothetical protein [Methylophaga sp.]|tara:strand:+ start:358 stop:555 length:198 start_codon:yes stop_codon:yes gene_type:complete
MEELIIQVIVMAILFLYPVWRIFKRAGLNPAISLTVLLPYTGILLSGIILAVSKWQFDVVTKGGK